MDIDISLFMIYSLTMPESTFFCFIDIPGDVRILPERNWQLYLPHPVGCALASVSTTFAARYGWRLWWKTGISGALFNVDTTVISIRYGPTMIYTWRHFTAPEQADDYLADCRNQKKFLHVMLISGSSLLSPVIYTHTYSAGEEKTWLKPNTNADKI